jgi:histidine triad (HIT) family protein
MPHRYDPGNVFARILRGEIPAERIHETAHALAFADIRPQAPTHVLVIPKGPYVTFDHFVAEAGTDEIAGFFRAVGEVCAKLGLDPGDGYRLIANAGAHSHQEVPHFHVHILAGRPLGPLLAQPG